MLERRPLLGLLIALTLCVSIWRISMQEPPLIPPELGYSSQQLQQEYHRKQSIPPQYNTESALFQNGLGTTTKNHGRNVNLKFNLKTIMYNQSNAGRAYDNFSYFNYNSPVNIDLLPMNDFNHLIDLKNFQFIINQESCSKDNSRIDQNGSNKFKENNRISAPLVLILVHSAPNNYMKRLQIRETWSSVENPYFRLLFLLGAVNSAQEQHRLELENNMFSDIVQGNFVDAYRNMTYKHVMALKWFTYFCQDAKFILKIDDDVFLNMPYLIDFLNRTSARKNLLFCQEEKWSRVKRSYRSKWRVSTKEYSGRYYPPYCPGYAIIYSPDVAFKLYKEAQNSPYFWIDDVHITGSLAKKANITITSFTRFILTQTGCSDLLAGKTDISSFLFLFSWPDIPEEDARKLWALIERLR